MSPTLAIVYLTVTVFPVFVKLYVLLCNTFFLLHDIDLLCHFIHVLAKCINDTNCSGRLLNMVGKMGIDRHIICFVHMVLKLKTKVLDSWVLKLLELMLF